MTVVKIIELLGESETSWEDAAKSALDQAAKTLRGIVGLDVVHFTCKVEDNKIVKYRANVKCAFKYEN